MAFHLVSAALGTMLWVLAQGSMRGKLAPDLEAEWALQFSGLPQALRLSSLSLARMQSPPNV